MFVFVFVITVRCGQLGEWWSRNYGWLRDTNFLSNPAALSLFPIFIFPPSFFYSTALSAALPPFIRTPTFLLLPSPSLPHPTVAFPYANDILCKIEYDAESALPPGTDRVLAVYNITGNTVYCYLPLPNRTLLERIKAHFIRESLTIWN